MPRKSNKLNTETQIKTKKQNNKIKTTNKQSCQETQKKNHQANKT